MRKRKANAVWRRDWCQWQPPSLEVATIHLSCHRCHARKLSNWRSHHQGAAVGCPLGPSTTQESGGEYLVAEWLLSRCCGQYVMHDACLPKAPPPKMRWRWGGSPPGAWTSPARDQEGAEAIACPLGIQPSINRHLWPLLQIGQLLGLMQL
jgi:hypothetical protein